MDDALEAARQVLATTTARWQSLVNTLPEWVLERRPAPGEWSAADCLSHLLTIERLVIPVRVRHVLEGRPQLIPHDPDAPREPNPERTPGELAAAFAACRRQSEPLLARLTPADVQRSSQHPEFGTVTLGDLLNLWAAHDLQHTVQAEEAVMQAFIPGTGPWRAEFADHDAAGVPSPLERHPTPEEVKARGEGAVSYPQVGGDGNAHAAAASTDGQAMSSRYRC